MSDNIRRIRMKRVSAVSVMMCFSVAFILVFSLTAGVQGTIKGVVTDINGNPIDGVKITISSMRYAAVRYTLKSNKKGEFIQIGLQPDYYQVSAEKDGYLPVVFETRVAISQIVEANFEMEEGKYYVGDPPGEKDFKQGNEWFAKGMYEEAGKSYQKAIEKEPEEPVYYNNLGISFTKLERFDEAIDVYKKMLEVQPSSYTANKNLGELYGMQKKYPEAMPYFSKAAELSPDDPDAFYNLGACLMNTGSRGEAVDAFTKAIEIKSDHAMAHYQLGMIYVNQNNKEEAIKHLEKFLELAPNDPNAPVARQIIDYLK
jgi:tetratricopeptide (TPR) repeat protein